MGSKYNKRQKFYSNFVRFLLYLKSEIGFFKTNLIEIISNYNSHDEIFDMFMQQIHKKLLLNESVFVEILTKDENYEIERFIENLGKGDCFTREEYLSKNIEYFENKLLDVKNLNKKYGNLYKKLGILLALFVCIVLI